LINTLRSVGLSEKEARTYLALLQLGTASSYAIAEKSGLKKPTTYVILEELMGKGIVIKIPTAKKQRFSAVPPEQLFQAAEQKIMTAKQSLRELESLKGEKISNVKTLLYEGLNGIREALNYRLDDLEGTTIYGFWAHVANAEKEVVDLFLKHDENYQKKNITISGITPDDESTKIFREKFAGIIKDFKLVSKHEYSSEISIEITTDFVRILDPIQKNALIIENRRVADTLKQIYRMVEKSIEKH